MMLRKIVKDSVSWAAMGCALTGVAFGQVPDAGIGAGANTDSAQIGAKAATEAPVPAAAIDGSANVNSQGVDTNAGVSSNRNQAGSNAAIRNDGVNVDSNLNSNTNAGATDLNSNVGVNGSLNDARVNQDETGSSNLNPFGATFDSSANDRLIIQQSAPNSAASRLGLQTGDRIIGVNGRTYSDVNQFNQEMGRLNGNNSVPIIYERDGRVYTRNFQPQFNNGQQTSNGSTYGNQGSSNQSYDSGQNSHSVSRPIYGGQGNTGYSGGMGQNQGDVGGSAGCGTNFSQSQTCCAQTVAVQMCCHRAHHGHRNRNRGCR